MVKGKAKPVEAFVVGEVVRGPETEQVLHDDWPLLGRDPELEVIDAAIDEGRRGRGGLVEITGDAGIGKSRLVAAARERAMGDYVVLEGRAELYEQSTPYFPWRRVLRRAIGAEDLSADDLESALR
jgi:predicted ATPase